jgi:hypothetical protein
MRILSLPATGIVVVLSLAPQVRSADRADLAVETPAAEHLVARAIEVHDPDDRFLNRAHRFRFVETRPDGEDRRVEVVVDVPGQRFERRVRREAGDVVARVDGDRCSATVAGERPDPETARALRLTCDRIRWMRDYYTYLWGLPMKLRDPGTRLGDVRAVVFEGREAWRLRVTYDADVGTDVWYVMFDRTTGAMIGYGFYKDEDVGDGEVVVLRGEVAAAGMRLPAERAWTTHLDDRYLGTDTLVSVEPLDDGAAKVAR